MGSHRVSLDIDWPVKPATPTKRPLRTHLYFVSTLLGLRGDVIVSQPLVDPSTGCCFAWNGEAWKIGSDAVVGNDTLAVFSLLLEGILSSRKSSVSDCERGEAARTAFGHALGSIVGPFSFVFYDAIYHRVFFGRDRLGRRTLMFRRELMDEITIASVSDGKGKWIEVKANGAYELDLKQSAVGTDIVGFETLDPLPDDLGLHRLPWKTYCLPSKLDGVDTIECSCNSTHNHLSLTPLNRNVEHADTRRLNPQSNSVMQLDAHLRSSLKLRIQTIPSHDSEALLDGMTNVAILFSGGVDCSVIARITHDVLPKNLGIDLLNVAFENPRSVAAAKASAKDKSDLFVDNPYARCPDRITGLSSYAELIRTCPNRSWRFVSINIPFAEMIAHRDKVISLIHPHNTEMDFSIACALYFAARGQGVWAAKEGAQQSYTTSARVLLSGLGADELFAGYTRHATAYYRHGYCGILDELDLDINRMSERNLGRDDRIIGYWGKEVRYPFLDEDLVNWAMALPLWEKCGFGQGDFSPSNLRVDEPRIEPAKQILRVLAWKLGMSGAAMERKRAIQFGARTAKMVAGKTKGTEIIR